LRFLTGISLLTAFQIIHDPDEKVPHYDDEKIIMFGDHFHEDAEKVSFLPP